MNKTKIFNVATYKRDSFLLKTIESIYEQADVINVALNSHTEKPKELIDSKINLYLTDNSIGDGFKFLRMEQSDGFFFTIDDDLIYPKNYSDYMIEKYLYYDCKRVVTLHGRSFKSFPISSYYRGNKIAYRCLGDVVNDVNVQFGGTGVMLIHTDLFKLPINYIKHPNMADIWVGNYCYENNIQIVCVKHDSNFLDYQSEVGNDTIHNKTAFSDKTQTNVVNGLWK